MFEQRRGKPVDEARGVRFLVAEHFLERPFDQFLRRDRYRESDRQFAQIGGEAEEFGVDGARCHDGDADILRAEFVPKGLEKL